MSDSADCDHGDVDSSRHRSQYFHAHGLFSWRIENWPENNEVCLSLFGGDRLCDAVCRYSKSTNPRANLSGWKSVCRKVDTIEPCRDGDIESIVNQHASSAACRKIANRDGQIQ